MDRCAILDGAAVPRRILVAIKYRFLGDAVLATPALRRARRAWPDAHIALLTGPDIVTLLRGCPDVDEYLVLDSPWREWGPLANLRLIKLLRRRGFDTAILLNRAFQPALAAYGAGIPHRIGLDTDYRGWLLTRRLPAGEERHELDCHRDLLRAAGASLPTHDAGMPQLWVAKEERHAAVQLLARRGTDARMPLIGMQPGSRRCDDPRQRDWGTSRFAAVADRLAEQTGGKVLLLGTAEERSISESVAAAMHHRPVIMTGQTSLREVVALISHCQIWISNDTGLRHIAVALNVPSVAIMPSQVARRWGYHTSCHRTLTAEWSGSGGDAARTPRACLDAVSADQVVQAALAVWRVDNAYTASTRT